MRTTLMKGVAALSLVTALGLAAQPARAGITLNVSNSNGGTIGPVTEQVGTDPATLPIHGIVSSFSSPLVPVPLGPNSFLFNGLTLSQTYSPISGSPSGIVAALADSSTLSLVNFSGPDATITLTIAYDSYNYPATNPLQWTSTVTASRLDGTSTFTGSETIGGTTIDHPTLTGADITPGGSASNTIITTISPGRPFTVTQTLTIFIQAGQGVTLEKSDTLAAVPEPATVAMALTGLPLVGMAWLRRRKKNA